MTLGTSSEQGFTPARSSNLVPAMRSSPAHGHVSHLMLRLVGRQMLGSKGCEQQKAVDFLTENCMFCTVFQRSSVVGIYNASAYFQNYFVEKGFFFFLEQKGSFAPSFPTVKSFQLAMLGPLSISSPPAQHRGAQPDPTLPTSPSTTSAHTPPVAAVSGFSTLQPAYF